MKPNPSARTMKRTMRVGVAGIFMNCLLRQLLRRYKPGHRFRPVFVRGHCLPTVARAG